MGTRLNHRVIGKFTIIGLLLFDGNLSADEPTWTPFPVGWNSRFDSPVSLSFLLDRPAGKEGFIRTEGGHLVRPSGDRLRIWGVNITARATIPTKAAAVRRAAHLARLGINCVRLHFLDRVAPHGLGPAHDPHTLGHAAVAHRAGDGHGRDSEPPRSEWRECPATGRRRTAARPSSAGDKDR